MRSWDRSRQHDHKLRSPARTEQSPQDQGWRQHDHKLRSPARTEHSPQDPGWRQHDHKLRSPARAEQSPQDQGWRQYDPKLRSPARTEQSPRNQSWRHNDHKLRSPARTEQSPRGQGWRQNDHKLRSPARTEQSPHDQGRRRGLRDCTPNLGEESPLDRTTKDVHEETSCKNSSSENINFPNSCKSDEDKHIPRESTCSVTESEGERNVQKTNESIEKDISSSQPVDTQQSCSPIVDHKESPQCDAQPPPDELLSMEEDMDICDTPPHVPVVTDLSSGKWFYLDYGGVENGPTKLCDIKALVDEGVLMSDHFIKHLDSNRWLTVENAVSPLVAQIFPSVVSDTITQLVNPPEASGNLLADTADMQSAPANNPEMLTPSPPRGHLNNNVLTSELLDNFYIDERVQKLLEGYDVIPGMELEAIKGILFCQCYSFESP
jgi:[histone H3]-lysine4 N-trimethyltransferase ATXR3